MTAVRSFADELSTSRMLRPKRWEWLEGVLQRSNLTSSNSLPAQSTVAMRRWGLPAIVTLAAMAALTALTAEAAAPRDAGEPIMAIVSIKSQQVTFYDADGWILRAPVSTGTTGRETPAG